MCTFFGEQKAVKGKINMETFRVTWKMANGNFVWPGKIITCDAHSEQIRADPFA